MVKGGLPGQTGAIFHFWPYLPISGAGKGFTNMNGVQLLTFGFSICNLRCTIRLASPRRPRCEQRGPAVRAAADTPAGCLTPGVTPPEGVTLGVSSYS